MDESFLGVPIPNGSVYSVSEYRDMYQTANTVRALTALQLLDQHNDLTARDARAMMRDPNAGQYLAQLHDANLAGGKYAPLANTVVYVINGCGQTILEHGARDGVKRLMRDEWNAESGWP